MDSVVDKMGNKKYPRWGYGWCCPRGKESYAYIEIQYSSCESSDTIIKIYHRASVDASDVARKIVNFLNGSDIFYGYVPKNLAEVDFE